MKIESGKLLIAVFFRCFLVAVAMIQDHSELTNTPLNATECRAFNTPACQMLFQGMHCDQGWFYSICNPSADSKDIKEHFTKMSQKIPKSPLVLRLEGPDSLNFNPTNDSLFPMRENIIILLIERFSGFNTDKLSGLGLTNVIDLTFSYCHHVRVTRKGLMDFGKLKSLVFKFSTVAYIERNVLEVLPGLKQFHLEDERFIEEQQPGEKHAYMYRIYCSSEYQWLRDFLKCHSDLTKPVEEGKIYRIADKYYNPKQRPGFLSTVNCRSPLYANFTSVMN